MPTLNDFSVLGQKSHFLYKEIFQLVVIKVYNTRYGEETKIRGI